MLILTCSHFSFFKISGSDTIEQTKPQYLLYHKKHTYQFEQDIYRIVEYCLSVSRREFDAVTKVPC